MEQQEGAQEFNPRFVAFAKTHCQTPAEALAASKARGTGMEFILWINAKWRKWRALNNREQFCSLSPADHALFDQWLDAEVQA